MAASGAACTAGVSPCRHPPLPEDVGADGECAERLGDQPARTGARDAVPSMSSMAKTTDATAMPVREEGGEAQPVADA